jgi:transcriptional regulator CtsR
MSDMMCWYCSHYFADYICVFRDEFTGSESEYPVCGLCFNLPEVHEKILSFRKIIDDCPSGIKEVEGNPMAKKFNVVVSLPKGVTESNFADNVGVIREAKRKDGSLIKMKDGGIVYRFPLNVTKLSAMIKKHSLKKVDKYGQDTVWLSVFEKNADAKSSATGSSGSEL